MKNYKILMSGHLRLQQVQEMGVYLDKILSLLGRGDKEHVYRHPRIGECTIEDNEVSHVVRSLAPTSTSVSAE